MEELITKINQLVIEGEKLRPKGGSLFAGYNGIEQPQYSEWRSSVIDTIRLLGKKGISVVKEIMDDKHGEYFYERSVANILKCLKGTLSTAEEMKILQQKSKGQSENKRSTFNEKKTIFVVHGRNERIRKSIFDFLRALGLQPIEWSKAMEWAEEPAPYIGEILERGFANAQATVVILSGDDEARLKKELIIDSDPNYEKNLTPQPRPNVLFEAGMAFASMPKRTILVQIGEIRPYSDIAGRFVIRMNNSPEKRSDLVQKLKVAGCEFEPSGVDWLSTGDFENA